MVDLSVDSGDLIYNMDSDAETHASGAAEGGELSSMDVPSPSKVAKAADSATVIQGNIGSSDNLSSCC